MEMTGAQLVVAALEEQGVDVVFGYPGGKVLDIYDALYARKEHIRHVLGAHEQGAAHAADGYARTTGKTGVVIATSGPGATNLVTGLANAYLDSIPMVAITGNVPRAMKGKDSFQEVDITGVSIPITKHSFFIRETAQIPQMMKLAFEIANSGRPGPVLLDFPSDLMAERVEYMPAGHYEVRKNPAPEKEQIEQLAAAVSEAQKPVLLVGGGIKAAKAETMVLDFVNKTDMPVVSTSMGLSVIPYNHPNYYGLVGMHGTAAANCAINDSDLLIAIGTRFSDRIVGNKHKFAPHAKIIHVDIDSSEFGKNVDIAWEVEGAADDVLRMLLPLVEEQKHKEWNALLQRHAQEHPLTSNLSSYGIEPRKLIDAVSTLTDHKALIVTDVGQHQMWVAQSYEFTEPNTFASSLGLGTMGYGLGAANGVQVGHPDRPVVLFTGDGSFHMNLNELAVSVSDNLPVVVLLLNNNTLGMVRQWQKLFFKNSVPTSDMHRQTDYVKLAEAFGAVGMRMEQDDEIIPTLQKALSLKRPVVIECIVDTDYDVYPFIPAGRSYTDMLESAADLE